MTVLVVTILFGVFVADKKENSANRYYAIDVNYFDIQVLMMVTETKTLTSILHHNIFTYLDYVFSATFIQCHYKFISITCKKHPVSSDG